MTPAAMRHAPAILQHLVEDREIASLPLTVGAVWLYLVLAMLDRAHTGYGLVEDAARLSEQVVCHRGEMETALAMLLELRLLERGVADPYLRSPFLMRLLRPSGRR
ncbi:hypothetical protein [Roseococcus pinisoli]|uniref:Uncharacterized protein n=1 Tax=Roseococcus pinisoli TaxID=2835040 RepID=A0ABS5Q9Y7_9PROT|nr:hypothetical protein [Roseococcus pinisoli]MBS7810522.1 hypothetical protein [Roseococcus pinisoli]